MRFFFILSTLFCGLLLAEEKPSSTANYVRWTEGDDHSSLETAIGHFEQTDGRKLDLIGAVHIADKAYYTDLNRRFKNYDALLYEMVGGPVPKTNKEKEDRAKARDSSSLAWVGQLHETMQRTLALSSQMAEVDYSPNNFVHADVSLQKFQELKKQKQESFLGLMMKAMVVQADLEAQGKLAPQPDLVQLLGLLVKGGSASDLKRIIGAQFDQIEALISGIEGPDGSVIIGERNRTALDVLEKQLSAGKKKLGIFYGAAHLPDMESRLLKSGWKKTGTTWLPAWTVK